MQRVIAKLVGFHGLKGELKLQPLFDDPELLAEIESLNINGVNYELESYREHKNFILVKLKSVPDLTAAERLFKPHTEETMVSAELEDDLEPGEFYLDDLKGMIMLDAESGSVIGTVEDCTDGMQTLLVTRLKADGRELLVPLVAEYIINIDAAARTISARISPDLLELAK